MTNPIRHPEHPTERVKVLSIRLTPQERGALRAFADVEVNGWFIRDFRVVGRNGHSLFVSPPMSFIRDPKTQEIIRKPVIVLPFAEKQMIDSAILDAYQKLLEESREKGQESQR